MNSERLQDLPHPAESILAIPGTAARGSEIHSPMIERYVSAQAFQAVHTLRCLIWAGFDRNNAFEIVSREVQKSFQNDTSIQKELERVAEEEFAAYQAAQAQKERPDPVFRPNIPPSKARESSAFPLDRYEMRPVGPGTEVSGTVSLRGVTAPAQGTIWAASA